MLTNVGVSYTYKREQSNPEVTDWNWCYQCEWMAFNKYRYMCGDVCVFTPMQVCTQFLTLAAERAYQQ